MLPYFPKSPYLTSMHSARPDISLWQRLRRHRPAMAGLSFIALVAAVAVLGYLITPDNSPQANYQFPELALQDPGFSVPVLRLPRQTEAFRRGLLRRMLSGQPPRHRWIPLQGYRFRGDSLFLQPWQREGSAGDEQAFHLLQLTGRGVPRPLSEAEREELQQSVEKEHFSHRRFLLGTDKFGRCFLSRLIIGARISLAVGLIAVLISLSIGLLLGALAGYYGGRTDDAILLLINTVWSIPTLLLVFAIVLALGRHPWNVYAAIGLTMWVDVARLVRGQVMEMRTQPFVEAGRSMGFHSGRILLRHILPNIVGPLLVVTAANFAMAILIEAGLSYLGFGIQPPQPSWGNMLNENYGFALSGKPFLALTPALAIMLLVLAFNLLGNGLRDVVDVKRSR